MAFCLVPDFPDFPAVLLALEHLKDLDKQLGEDGVQFAQEASIHLTAITAAIAELEAIRCAAREHLEVETIENSKLRLQIKNMSDRMDEDIMADVAAARASNADEIEQLRKELQMVSQLQEHSVEKQQALLNLNRILHSEREHVKADHEAVIATLNDQLNLKYSLKVQLDQKLQLAEELKSSIAAAKQEQISLQQNMTSESEMYSEKTNSLSTEADEIVEKIMHQDKVITKCRQELLIVNKKKEETLSRLGELNIHVRKLESNLQRVTASRCQCEQQLEEESKRNEELRQQKEILKEEVRDLEEAFRLSVQNLQEQISSTEGKIEESQASGLLLKKALSQVYEIFKHQQDEENEARAEYLLVSWQLAQSRLQLEERKASIIRYSKEIEEMESRIKDLQEAEAISRQVFEINWEELSRDLETVNVNINQYEEEKTQLCQLLEETKSWQEEHVEKMTSDISNTKRRYKELLQEDAALLQLQPMSADADLLISHMTQMEMDYRKMEGIQQQEVQQIIAETENICRSIEEKQGELKEKEKTLKEVEANWTEEINRHDRLRELARELNRKRSELELSIQNTKQQTKLLLESNKSMKTELEELQESTTHTLNTQTSELRAVEVSLYNDSLILVKVRMENSRMHLRIEQMTEDVTTYRQKKEQYQQEDQELKHKTKDILEGLQEAWKEDILVTLKCEGRDKILLVSMNSLMNQLKTREKQLMNIGKLLQQKMLDFSKRLGSKTTI